MSDPKVVVKIGSKMVEFTINDDERKSNYRILTDDEATEHFLLTKSTENEDAHLQAELNQLVEQVTQQTKDSFKKSLQTTVLRMLGFTDSWSNGWQVDSNNVKVTVINELISQEMKSFIAKEIVDPAKVFTAVEVNNMLIAAKKKFKENYEYTIKRHVHEEMDKQIKATIGKMIRFIIVNNITSWPTTMNTCDRHGHTKFIYVGLFVQSPFCEKCLIEFKEEFDKFMSSSQVIHVIPIIELNKDE